MHHRRAHVLLAYDSLIFTYTHPLYLCGFTCREPRMRQTCKVEDMWVLLLSFLFMPLLLLRLLCFCVCEARYVLGRLCMYKL